MTIARDIAKSIGSSVRSGKIAGDGDITGDFNATIYDSTVNLPTTGVLAGAQAYVSSNQRLYIRGTGGWYNIATINNTPTINSVQTAGGDSSPFELAIDGSTTTVITITATDSEGFPITFSAVTDVGFDSIATVSSDSSVFTITPFSEDSAGDASSGTITFKASDGVNIASEVATFTIAFRLAQSKFTTLLVKASGNDGTNTSVTDTSDNTHTITNTNARTQGFTPYHPGGYSTHFDGTGDYLSVAYSADHTFGSGQFTAEVWVYMTAYESTGFNTFLNKTDGTNNDWQFDYKNTSTELRFIPYVSGSANTSAGVATTTLDLDTWHHVAVSRDGSNNLRLFHNGLLLKTASFSSTIDADGNATLEVGARNNGGTRDRLFTGYMRDVRIVKGTAVYTADFAPPTSALTAVTNTKLLACGLPYFGDGSSDSHSITVNGNAHPERFGPYDYPKHQHSKHGASVYFDGNGDYLTIASGASELDLGTGNFTIESWVYPEEISTNYPTFLGSVSGWNAGASGHRFDNSGYAGKFWFGLNGAGGVSSGDPFMASANTFPHNAWHHYVLTRTGNTWRMFVNGNLQEVQTYSGSYNLNYGGTRMGYSTWDGGQGWYKGFVSDLRVVKGSVVTAYQTSSTTEGDQIFTPPAAPLTKITDTQLLTCNTKPNVYDIGTGTRAVLSGNSNASTDQKKYGTSSLHFDGSGDYIDFAANTNLDLGTEPMTMEAWFRTGVTTNDTYFRRIVMLDGPTLNNASNPQLMIDGDASDGFAVAFSQTNELDIRGTTAYHDNNWHHMALTRNGPRAQLFADGVHQGYYNIGTQAFSPNSGAPRVRIGNYNGSTGEGEWNGYIQDVRITKGLSRYPFIPPTETLKAANDANTKLIAWHAAAVTTDGAGLQTLTANGTPTAKNFGPHSGMRSVYFDGTDDALRTNDNTSLSLSTGDFSVEAWIRPDNTSTAYRAIISDNLYGSTGSWCIYMYGTKLYVASNNSAINDLGGSGNTLIEAGVWQHIAFTRDSGTARLFHNGTQVGSDTSLSTNFTDDQIVIGANNHSGGYPAYDYIGYISNVRVIKGSTPYVNSFTVPSAELEG